MQYLKHYWISIITGSYAVSDNPVEKRHPEAEFPGLDVKIWMSDENGIDVCLSVVPDTTSVSDIIIGDKKAVQVLTEDQFNSVSIPYLESQLLYSQARENGEEDAAIIAQADLKLQEARQALYTL